MVYSVTFAFSDGSVFGCGPERKPATRRIKEEGIRIDEDGVFREYLYSADGMRSWTAEQREKASTILANRLNTRRAIRELVVPELAELKAMLLDVQERLGQAEQAIAKVARPDTSA